MGRLACRLAGPDDADAMVELWTKHSGWGELAGAAWSEALTDGPFTRPHIVLAEDLETGALVGQIICHRLFVNVAGTVRPTIRPFAAILAADQRGFAVLLQEEHPLKAMTSYSFEVMPTLGIELVYWLPDPRFARFLRQYSQLSLLRFPLFSRSFTPADVNPVMPAGHQWSPYEIDDRVTDLCSSAHTAPCHLVHTKELLQWKQRVTSQQFISVERHGELVAIAGARRHGDRQWQIEDVLGYDDTARRAAVVASTALCSRREAAWEPPARARKASILTTPTMEPFVSSIGFERERYEFVLAVGALTDAAVEPARGDPAAWYLSASD